MNISISDKHPPVPFTLWQPGEVLKGIKIALDTETELIRPGQTPRLVVAIAFDGEQGFFIAAQQVRQFVEAHGTPMFLFHNAAFDIPVLEKAGASFTPPVEDNRVFDTALLFRLLNLADVGQANLRWSLDHAAETLLDIHLPKDVLSADGKPVRKTFGRFLKSDGLPDYPQMLQPEHRVYLEYAAKDAVVTLLLGEALNKQAQKLFGNQALNIFDRASYASVGEIDKIQVGRAWQRHGFLTHDIQLKASLALAAMQQRGLCIDTSRVGAIVGGLDSSITDTLQILKDSFHWEPGAGSQKSFASIMARLEKEVGEKFSRTESGQISQAADDLEEYRIRIPFIDAFLRYKDLSKLRKTFMAPLEANATVVRGKFNVLVNSGRTSCSGNIDDDEDSCGLNLQNLPREGGVRECLQASPGHFLLSSDYVALEMATLAQHCFERFGFSKLRDAISKGADLHALDAAMRVGIDLDKLPDWKKQTIMPLLGPDGEKLRDKSKAKNFGLPGGLGAKTFCEYARANYGLEMLEAEAKEEKLRWLENWPEMKLHLQSDDAAAVVGQFYDFWLTHPRWNSFAEASSTPWPFHIFKGVICGQTTTKTTERPYDPDEIEWAWSVALVIVQDLQHLNETERGVLVVRIQERLAGFDLWQSLVPRQRFVATLTGRLRGHPTYCAARNCVFQGPAADGAKRALYRLHREGFRVVNFIHDEFLVELPEKANHAVLAERIKAISIEEMRYVTPDVAVNCEYALMRRWYKGAKAKFVDGCLVPVRPEKAPNGNIVWVEDN